MSLTYKIQEALEYEQEALALRAGVLRRDITFSRITGIDARDVRVFREYTRRGVLIIVRCPQKTALAWHGRIPAELVQHY